jgi:hypothetical protein
MYLLLDFKNVLHGQEELSRNVIVTTPDIS